MFVETDMDKRIIKRTLFTILLAIALFCAVFAAACGKPEEKIELYYDYDAAIVTKEYDAKTIVSDSNGYDVILIECYYLDGDMQRVDIPIVGETKFTPTVEREIFITLRIKGGTYIKEATISVEAPISPEQQEFMNSWNDEGVGKVVTANSAFLYGDADSVIKVSYMGSQGSQISGPGIGGFYYDDKSNIPFSVTDWSNAVMVMDIYNPMDFDLAIYYCMVKDKATMTLPITGLYGQQRYAVLPAGEWTSAVLSLNMIGIDFNPFLQYKGNMHIGFRVGHIVLPSAKPYEWTIYIANMDITDYSIERFPDLETKRFDQILAEMDGEDSDKAIYSHLLEENTDFRYQNIKTTGDIIAYADAGIEKPDSQTGDYVNVYTVTPDPDDQEETGQKVYSTPLYYNHNGRYRLSTEEAELDFSKAVISFDIYNPNPVDLPVYLVHTLAMYVNYGEYGATAKAGAWTKITLPLDRLEIGSTYTFAVSIGGLRYGYETLTYYIDNLSVYEREILIGDAEDEEMKTHLFASGSSKWAGCSTAAETVEYASLTDIQKPADVTGETLVKYTFTSSGAWLNTLPLRYDSVRPFTAEQKTLNFSKVAISFYVYNPSDEVWTAYLSNSPAVYYTTVNSASKTVAANGWTKIEFVLADLNINVNGSYDVCIYLGGTVTDGEGAIYYIDGLSVYETFIPDADDKVALTHLYANGSTRWTDCTTTAELVEYSESGITPPENVTGESLIKYYYTSTNNGGGTVLNSVPLRYTSGTQTFTAEQKEYDFTKVHISFYIYNPNSFDLSVYAVKGIGVYFTANHGTAIAKAGEWTKIEFDLSPYEIDPNGSYDVVIGIGGDRNNAFDGINYYIDCVEIYEQA